MAISSGNGGCDTVLTEMNVTPLVDVMLVLLVVFIITIPVINNAVAVNLPETEKTETPPDDSDVATITIKADGEILLDDEVVESDRLESVLSNLKQNRPAAGVVLQADKETTYQHVAHAMVSMERAGISKVSVITQPK